MKMSQKQVDLMMKKIFEVMEMSEIERLHHGLSHVQYNLVAKAVLIAFTLGIKKERRHQIQYAEKIEGALRGLADASEPFVCQPPDSIPWDLIESLKRARTLLGDEETKP